MSVWRRLLLSAILVSLGLLVQAESAMAQIRLGGGAFFDFGHGGYYRPSLIRGGEFFPLSSGEFSVLESTALFPRTRSGESAEYLLGRLDERRRTESSDGRPAGGGTAAPAGGTAAAGTAATADLKPLNDRVDEALKGLKVLEGRIDDLTKRVNSIDEYNKARDAKEKAMAHQAAMQEFEDRVVAKAEKRAKEVVAVEVSKLDKKIDDNQKALLAAIARINQERFAPRAESGTTGRVPGPATGPAPVIPPTPPGK